MIYRNLHIIIVVLILFSPDLHCRTDDYKTEKSAAYSNSFESKINGWCFANLSNTFICSLNPQVGIFAGTSDHCFTLNADIGISGMRYGLGYGLAAYNHAVLFGAFLSIEYIQLYNEPLVDPLWVNPGFRGIGIFAELFWRPKLGFGLYRSLDDNIFMGKILFGFQIYD